MAKNYNKKIEFSNLNTMLNFVYTIKGGYRIEFNNINCIWTISYN